jgi:hypothetical protein
VRQHAASFIAHTEASTGAELPRFIKEEFDAFLECGILAHGFLRLRCGDCGRDKLLAFSCKRRGFCPSCGARRMSQAAAHLVDRVIPHVPVRQWVLSLPIPLRVLLAAQPELVTPVLQVVQRVVERRLLDHTGLSSDEGQGGAVTLIQRFGSAANLNVHLHCLVLDGVYRCDADGVPGFIEAGAPTDEELHALLRTVIARLMKMLTRRGVLVQEMGQACPLLCHSVRAVAPRQRPRNNRGDKPCSILFFAVPPSWLSQPAWPAVPSGLLAAPRSLTQTRAWTTGTGWAMPTGACRTVPSWPTPARAAFWFRSRATRIS